MQKFPSIESFANVYRNVVSGLMVRPKIKLHGTNGGIRIEGVKAIAPTRRLLIRLTETNMVLARNTPHPPSVGARK